MFRNQSLLGSFGYHYPRLPKTVYFTAVLTKTVYWGRRFIFPFFCAPPLGSFSPFSTSNRHSQSLGPVISRFSGYPNPRQKNSRSTAINIRSMEINRGSTVCPRFIHGLSMVCPRFRWDVSV